MTDHKTWKADLFLILQEIGLANGWTLALREDLQYSDAEGNHRFYFQIQFREADNVTGVPDKVQYCRKWYLSPHMTKQEVVRTAYKAFEAAVLHEMQEKFLYNGRQIYGPHTDVDALWEVSTEVDIRSNHS